MRLRRLGLSRYGLFDGHEIDFGPGPEGTPDLHVIYGPNEAGKSTALAGFLDLLFAFEHRSGYAYLHGYDAMKVEADLEIGGKAHHFVRIRKRRGSLLDDAGQVLPEGVLANALGGISRDAYKAMFSLDDDTLEAGGEEILRSEGDLGRLLFAGGAGLVELGETLKKLRERTDEFHRSRARNTELRALKDRLSTLAEQKRRLDVAASTYARLVEKRKTAQAAYDGEATSVAKLETRREDAGRRLAALPWVSELRRLREELADLDSLPEPPQVWFERIGVLLENEPRLAVRIEGLEKQKKDLVEKREALPPDDAILILEERAARLDTCRARYITAEEDLPRRRDTLAECKGGIESILRRLEMAPDTDPSSLVVPAAVVGALRELIERRSGIEAHRNATAVELKTAESDAAQAAEALEKDGAAHDAAGEAAFARLGTVLDDARRADRRAHLDLHVRQRRRFAAQRDDKMEGLRPWSGDAEGLARVEVPEPRELEAWRTTLEAADREIERLESEKAALAAERDGQSARAGAAKAEGGVADDDEAAALRTSRDEAWKRHRATLDGASADVFEERMNAHDAAADGRLAHAEALARVRQAADDLRRTDADRKRNEECLARAVRRRQSVVNEIAASVATMIRTGAADMPPDVSLARLAAWTERRADIVATLAEIRGEDREIERAREDGAGLRARLVGALAAAGAPPEPASDIEALVSAAQAVVDAEKARQVKVGSARERLERARATLERRRDAARRAGEDDAGWRREWAAALSRCWLRGIDPTPSGAEVRRILDDVTALEAAHGEHAALAARIATMERDRAAFVDEVGALAKEAGETFDAARVREHDESLRRRLAEEAARRKARDGLGKEIEGIAAQLSRAANEMTELRAEAGLMFEAFEVDGLRDVDEKLKKAQRRTALRKTLAEREARLTEAMNAASPRDAEAALAGADRDALEAEAAGIAAALEERSACKQARFHSLQQANDALAAVGGDDAAARLEQERRTILLAIEEGARDWLRVRFGVAAAERALGAYREKHRSSMMKNASAAFRTISRGAYARLDSQLADEGEVLIGVPAAGGAKIAPEMSKGTRFQLYLALRVAGYREFADRHGPVPFIADDILETFDDFRAEEAFRLFADMAEFGQVVYLSHHRHLCDIARAVCPSVTVHALPGSEAPAPPEVDPGIPS